MNFGIPKKFIYISLVLFAFNMFAAVHTYVPEKGHNDFYQLAYITFPLWGAVMGGSLLGFVVLLFPVKQQLRPEVKYTRSKIVGILIVNLIFVLLYIYKLYYFYNVVTKS